MNNSVGKNHADAYDRSRPGADGWLHIGTRSVNSRNCRSFLVLPKAEAFVKYLQKLSNKEMKMLLKGYRISSHNCLTNGKNTSEVLKQHLGYHCC